MISFLKKYVRKFRYAFQGLFHGITHDRSILLQCLIGIAVIGVFALLGLNTIEWCIVIMLIGIIITLEFVNSSIETIVDFISPQYNEKAKIIKDYAAAAVLVMSIAAAMVALLILKGKLG
ncbi:diacylglycerol kinase [[Eubacterium] hominis]|uniref:diacylglycerol kinase n=1 Tax=[Eubacterium] hominis TaxID=2764325 RepID=UPI003A4DAF57